MPDAQKLQDVAKTFTKKTLPDSEVELSGEIPFDVIAPYEKQALEGLAKELELPGFRKGHVPAEMARKRLGDISVLEEQVELCMRSFYPALIEAQGLDAVGRPQIAITKLAPGNAVGIVARTAIYPEVKLPKDWKGIAKEIPLEPIVFEAPSETLKEEEKNDEIEKQSIEKTPEDIEKEKVRQEWLAKEKRRGAIIDALLAKTEVAVPKVFVESELEKIIAQLKDDVTRLSAQAGGAMPFEAYLKAVGKTEESLREEFRAQAASRAKLQLTLNKIADEEKIEADPEAVEQELKHAQEHFPDARPDLLRIHIQTVIRNEQILKSLEEGK
jgi:FKBP-type peptidyl-prolyl cis-trans isomerase (trigger factor)